MYRYNVTYALLATNIFLYFYIGYFCCEFDSFLKLGKAFIFVSKKLTKYCFLETKTVVGSKNSE